MKRLPTLSGIELEISNILEIQEGDLPEENARLLDEYLEMLANQEAAKADGIASYSRFAKMRVENLREEARRLTEKARALESRLQYMQYRIVETMRQYNLKRIQGDVYTVSVRESVSVDVYDQEALTGTGFAETRVEIKPDKKKIKEAIKAGASVPGARLQQNYYLQIS